MTDGEKKRLGLEWIMAAEYFGRPLNDMVVSMYVDDLEDLSLEVCLHAMRALRRQPKRRSLYLPADVRALAGVDPEDLGPHELAAKINTAIGKFGHPSPHKAEAFIGPVGWQVVNLMGGWPYLCRTCSAGDGTFMAQCRELCRAAIERDSVGPAHQLPAHMPAQLSMLAQGIG